MPSKRIPISAHYIARQIDLAELAQRVSHPLEQKTRNHYIFKVADHEWLLIYSFGVVVLVNLPEDFLKKFLTKKVRQCCSGIRDDKYSEEYFIVEDPEVERESAESEEVKVKQLTLERVDLIAEVMAQSVAIDAADHEVEHMFQQFSGYTTALEQHGRMIAPTKTMLKLIGKNYGIIESNVTRLSLLDQPDITWESPELEYLFGSMRSMFELDDRFKALNFKLELIKSHSSLFLDVIGARRIEKLEVIIIVLIAVEILLFLYELFGR